MISLISYIFLVIAMQFATCGPRGEVRLHLAEHDLAPIAVIQIGDTWYEVWTEAYKPGLGHALTVTWKVGSDQACVDEDIPVATQPWRNVNPRNNVKD